jgi:GntR family transcriptional regulator, transcriptional repressor for pyruvate dehydrogenase complex
VFVPAQFIAKPIRVLRAYDELAAAIRARILKGDFVDGQRLPSEAALAHEAQVSRSTVREALRVLQEGGFVERVSPKVLVVRRQIGNPAHREVSRALRHRNVSFDHLYEALLFLDPQFARIAAQRASPSEIAQLEENVAGQEAALDDFETWSRLHEEFHLIMAAISNNPALEIVRAPITDLLLPTLLSFVRSEEQTQSGVIFHRGILDGIRDRDPDRAAAMAERHITRFRSRWEGTGLAVDATIAEIDRS